LLAKRVTNLREQYPVMWATDTVKPNNKKADDPTSKAKVADSKDKQD